MTEDGAESINASVSKRIGLRRLNVDADTGRYCESGEPHRDGESAREREKSNERKRGVLE